MLIEGFEIPFVIESSRGKEAMEKLVTFLGIDKNTLDWTDNLSLAKSIDKKIKEHVRSEYMELWRPVIDIASKAGIDSPEPNTATIKFILDNKDEILSMLDDKTVGLGKHGAN